MSGLRRHQKQHREPWSDALFTDTPEAATTSNHSRPHTVPRNLLDTLLTFPLFKDAPKLFLTRVAAKLQIVVYHPQEYIIKEGDPALSMYWILKGQVSVTLPDGESIYAELTQGAFFGEIGILFHRPRTATVVARHRVLLGVLTLENLNLVLKLYPVIERRIRDEAQERLAMQEKRNRADMPILRPGRTPPPQRLHQRSLLLLSTVTQAAAIAVAPLPLSQIVSAAQDQAYAVSAADNVDQTVSIRDFISLAPIFANLPSDILHRLALSVEPAHYPPFTYVLRKGDRGADIYFISRGELEVLDPAQDTVLARLRPGAFFGEMSFLNSLLGLDPARTASIRSVSGVELLVVRSEELQKVCLLYPVVANSMRNTASQRIKSNKVAAELVRNPDGAATSTDSSGVTEFSCIGSYPASLASSHPASRSPSPLNQGPIHPLFNPNWSFASASSDPLARSRSVSPVTAKTSIVSDNQRDRADKSERPEPHILSDSKRFLERVEHQRLLPEIHGRSSDTGLAPPLPRGPLDIAVPAVNPPDPVDSFQLLSRRPLFQYMPHNKRIRLATLAGRRRSSVLVSTGSIPDKILLKAFEYLSLPELMRLRMVLRRWRQLLFVAPNLFHVLDLRPWNTSIDDRALLAITDFVGTRPSTIDISNCYHVTDEGFSYMVSEIGISGKIRVLKMRSIWEVSAMAIMDLASPSVGRYLEEVDLSNCRKVKDNVVERLIGWDNQASGTAPPQKNPLLDSHYHPSETGSKNLKVLNLGYCKHLTDGIMYHIAMHANQRLEMLDLTRCTTITDAGFQHWTYRNFPNLKKLSLKDCTFLSDKSVISLANAVPMLEVLDLNFCCALSDIAVEVLCLGCQNLRELDLSFCGSAVSDPSLVAISLHLVRLEKLVVKGCVRITRAGVDALLSGYSPLSHLNISQCRNAHVYPGNITAEKFKVNPSTKSAFITAGPAQKIIEIVI